jgi:quinol monooxygenase YgiN
LEGLAMVSGFAYMWEFKVNSESVNEFMKLYGPDGEWVQLFSKAEGYIRTELHRDAHEPLRFVTIDYWESKNHWLRFRTDFAASFDEIDKTGEALTESEKRIGEFAFICRIARH